MDLFLIRKDFLIAWRSSMALPVCLKYYLIVNMTAETVTAIVIRDWILQFVDSGIIMTDQGYQFKSQLFRELRACLEIQKFLTAAYHPLSNSLVERTH